MKRIIILVAIAITGCSIWVGHAELRRNTIQQAVPGEASEQTNTDKIVTLDVQIVQTAQQKIMHQLAILQGTVTHNETVKALLEIERNYKNAVAAKIDADLKKDFGAPTAIAAYENLIIQYNQMDTLMQMTKETQIIKDETLKTICTMGSLAPQVEATSSASPTAEQQIANEAVIRDKKIVNDSNKEILANLINYHATNDAGKREIIVRSIKNHYANASRGADAAYYLKDVGTITVTDYAEIKAQMEQLKAILSNEQIQAWDTAPWTEPVLKHQPLPPPKEAISVKQTQSEVKEDRGQHQH